MKTKYPNKGGRYYRVDGKLLTEKEYKAQQSQSKSKGDKK